MQTFCAWWGCLSVSGLMLTHTRTHFGKNLTCFCLYPLSRVVPLIPEILIVPAIYIRSVGERERERGRKCGTFPERWPGSTHTSHMHICTCTQREHTHTHTLTSRSHTYLNFCTHTHNRGPKITSVSHIESSVQTEKSRAVSSCEFLSTALPHFLSPCHLWHWASKWRLKLQIMWNLQLFPVCGRLSGDPFPQITYLAAVCFCFASSLCFFETDSISPTTLLVNSFIFQPKCAHLNLKIARFNHRTLYFYLYATHISQKCAHFNLILHNITSNLHR